MFAKLNLILFPEPVKSIVPVPDKLEVPSKFKFVIDVVAAAPNVIVLVPIATDELTNCAFDTPKFLIVTSPLATVKLPVLNVATPAFDEVANSAEIVNELAPTTVSIPSPAKNSNLPPSAVEFTVDDSSENCIKGFAMFAFVIPAVPFKFVFVRPDIIFVEAEILLFVNISVVAFPTNVSVEVGNVNVPILTIVDITGDVNVLFVNVFVEVSVRTTASKFILTVSPPETVVVIPALLLSFKVPPGVIEITEEASSVTFKERLDRPVNKFNCVGVAVKVIAPPLPRVLYNSVKL